MSAMKIIGEIKKCFLLFLKEKKILTTTLVFLVVGLSLLIPSELFIPHRFFKETQINLHALNTADKRSESAEVWILDAGIDGSKVDLNALIKENNGWNYKYDSMIYVPAAEENALVLNFGHAKTYSISFLKHSWSGRIEYSVHNRKELLDLYSDTSETEIRTYNAPLTFTGSIISIIVHLVYAVICLFIAICLYESPLLRTNKRENIKTALLFLLPYIIIVLGNNKIKASPSTSVFIFALCIASYLTLRKSFYCSDKEIEKHPSNIEKCFEKENWKWVVLVSICAAFGCFAYNIFSDGIYMDLTGTAFGLFFVAVSLCVPLVTAGVAVLSRLYQKNIDKSVTISNNVQDKIQVRIVAFIIASVCFLLALYAFMPGGYPPDTVSQFYQAKTGLINDTHPAFTTILIRWLLMLNPQPEFVLYVQMLCFAFVISKVAQLGYQIGAKKKTVYLLTLLFCLLPSTVLVSITPIKDSVFTYAMIYVAAKLFELSEDNKAICKISYVLSLSAGMFIMFIFRHNGVAPYLAVCVLLAVFALRNKGKMKAMSVLSIIISILMVVAVKGPLYNAYHVIPSTFTPYITAFCAVGSVENKGGTLSQESEEKLNSIMTHDEWVSLYDRFKGHDNYVDFTEKHMDLTGISMKDAAKIYLEALAKYPDIVIKDRLDGSNILWNVAQPDDEDCFNARYFDGVNVFKNIGLDIPGYDDGQVYYNHNIVSDFYRSLGDLSFPIEKTIDNITNIILWRSGLYIILILMLIPFAKINGIKRLYWAAVPFIGNTIIMVAGLYHQSYRYVYYVPLTCLLLYICAFAHRKER